MVVSCCICHKTARDGISMHRIPAVHRRMKGNKVVLLERRREAWIRALECSQIVDYEKLSTYYVCSKHFVSGKPAHFQDSQNVDWIPNVDIRNRNEEDESDKIGDELYEEVQSLLAVNVIEDDEDVNDADVEIPVEPTPAERIALLEAELEKKNEYIMRLERKVEKLSWTERTFERDDKKVLFYTGLPSLRVVNLILSYIEVPLSKVRGGKSKCSNFQKLLLTLMKLRHNVSYTGLSYRFNVWVREASYIFKTVCVILFESFNYLVHWPSRECLRAKVPECFKKAYGDRVAIIIDCFEIRSENPANMRARAQTYSPYKAGITGKYLIGITQQGHIAYVSDGYGGRVSDKFLTEDCGILDNLLPGDIVLADRGFTINELVCMRFAKLNMPAFTRGETQLQPLEIEKTRKIASVRIHVERVIGLIRNKFTILKSKVPITLLKARHEDKLLLDIVVSVCCMLTNMCESVIPLRISKSKKEKFLQRFK